MQFPSELKTHGLSRSSKQMQTSKQASLGYLCLGYEVGTLPERKHRECIIHTYSICNFTKERVWNQIWQAYLLMKVEAFDHRNSIARASIKPWQTKVSKLYSRTSNRTHIAVAPPSTPAETFLSLHRNTSATEHRWRQLKSITCIIEFLKINLFFVLCFT